MENKKRKILCLYGYVFFYSIFIISCLGINSVHAFTLGKTYDSTNWEEIKDMVPPSMLDWVKKGEFILKTDKLDFEYKHEKAFLEASQANDGKYDLDKDGSIINKGAGGIPKFIYGLPFPKIDPKDSRAAEKIMWNKDYSYWRVNGDSATGENMWIGKGGLERSTTASGLFFFYKGREQGALPNPNNYLQLQLANVQEPFDLRATVQMYLIYDDKREDTCFAYVPMIRRVRRLSAASRSDPFLGSDLSIDDANLWCGKNQSMRWKFIGEATILCAFTVPNKVDVVDYPDGSISRRYFETKSGFGVSGWKGAPWAPVTVTWHPRPVWIVEAIPRDPYYNYGRQIYYVDKEVHFAWFKVIYNRAGEYWKSIVCSVSHQVSPKGKTMINKLDNYWTVDDKMHHATVTKMLLYTKGLDDKTYMGLNLIKPEHYTVETMLQLSK